LKEEYKNGTRVSHFKDRDLWTGRKHSKKTIQKMSESAKGRIPWNKGRFHSEETKAKISAAMINREKS